MNFYEQKIQEINLLIKNNKYKEAIKLVEEELSMPYIPWKYTNQFEELFTFLKTKNNSEKQVKKKHFTTEEILSLLWSNNREKQAIALNNLIFLNLRLIKYELKKWIENQTNTTKNIEKFLIFKALSEQNIDINLQISHQKLNPNKDKTFLKNYSEKNPIYKQIENLFIKEISKQNNALQQFTIYLLKTFPVLPKDNKLFIQDFKNVIEYFYDNTIVLSNEAQKILKILSTTN